MVKTTMLIPPSQLIDFGTFLSGNDTDKKNIANQILKGFQTAGFIYLTNHGIAKDQVATVFGQSAQFFKLPQAQKNALEWTSAKANRGYTAHGREKVTMPDAEDIAALREANPDLKESLEIGREGEAGCPNQWPPENVGEGNWPTVFRTTMQEFHTRCRDLSVEVFKSIAVALGIDEDFFNAYTDQGDNTLRLLHYPSVKREVFEKNSGQNRAGEHTDFGK
jgi:isopenicillin N synthase-like dioxygenase